ncbi:MAG: hypothetical protein Q4C70_04705 [Planctomycetia bacterium]|nr:hypothetical protein [Planctomycetia bacterium]
MSQEKSESLPLWESACEIYEADLNGNGTGNSAEKMDGFSCATCPVKECPTRGLAESQIEAVLEAEQNARLSPVQMVFWSAMVFLFPLICAVVGICCWESVGGEVEGIKCLPREAGPVIGALVGFVTGLLVARLGVKFVVKG